MNLYAKLQNKPLIFKRITGVSIHEFVTITKKIEKKWDKKYIMNKKLSGRPYGLINLENHLLALLIYYRTYTTQLFVGFKFGCDASTICRGMKRMEKILVKTISIKKCRVLEEAELESLIVDVTEQEIQRPKKNQKKYYSGKKKRHTLKTEILLNKSGKLVGLSKSYPGSVHDFAIRKQSDKIPIKSEIIGDSGYQGIDAYHKKSRIPIKKNRGTVLSEESKKYNRTLSKERIYIEHKIRELKIFRILGGVYRNFKRNYGIKMNIIAGLVNIKNGF